MHKPIICLLVLAVAVAGCKPRIEERLMREITQACSRPIKSGCTVALRNVTPFDWERLYLFSSWTTADSIQRVIGFAYTGKGVADDYTRMVYTQGNAVVHEEDFQSFVYRNSTIDFHETQDSLREAKSPFLTPGNALFWVKKDKVEHACTECFHYSLLVKE